MNHIVVSFDLDFTLIDNREGILNSFKYAFDEFEIDPIEDARLEQTIGEPLHAVFSRFTDEDPKKLIAAFRNYYRNEGICQVRVYEGVKRVLTNLKSAGIILGVVTSKKRELAIKLLQHLDIFHYFKFVHGESESIKHKTDPNLKDFFYTQFPPQSHNYVIVGDHISDKQLAEMLECPFIGVLTGQQPKFSLKNGHPAQFELISEISELRIELIENLIKKEKKKVKK